MSNLKSLISIHSPGRSYQRKKIGTEFLIIDEILNFNVEPISPIVLGNCRHIDSFLLDVFISKVCVNGENILNWKNGPHGW